MIDCFRKLPGVGSKSAVRMAFGVLNMSEEEAGEFCRAVMSMKNDVTHCEICQNLSDSPVCSICSDDRRDRTTVCVVEDARAVMAIEKTRAYKGLYHVLGGVISPVDGISPDMLKIKELIARLRSVVDCEFVRLDYTEGIRILKESGKKFEFPCDWGCDLQSEHERYLVEEHFKKPVILINYPKEIKSFYMKQNDDGKTVRAMDVLFPKIGEIIGGSEREADYGKLNALIEERGMSKETLWWYLDTRRWGSAPHSGFGLGFERLLLFVTGMSNIRDVIPFPRTPKNAEY